jgi:hypothetical protein
MTLLLAVRENIATRSMSGPPLALQLHHTTVWCGATAFRTEADNAKYPLPHTPLQLEELTVERLRRVKYALAGTPDQVRTEIAALQTIYGSGGELEWFGWFFDQGFMSWEETQRQFEFFAEEIIPHFR